MQYMSYIATVLLLSTGFAQAEIPSGMPSNATAVTARDDCFQTLRGHVDGSARESGFQVMGLIEGYGAELANGDFQCMARFWVGTPGKRAETGWRETVMFANRQPNPKP